MSKQVSFALAASMILITPPAMAAPRAAKQGPSVQAVTLINPATNQTMKRVSRGRSGRDVKVRAPEGKGLLIRAAVSPRRGNFNVRFALRSPEGGVLTGVAKRYPYTFRALARKNGALATPGSYRLTATPVKRGGNRALSGARGLNVSFTIARSPRASAPDTQNPGGSKSPDATPTPGGTTPQTPQSPGISVPQTPVPSLGTWESQMVQFGRRHCQNLQGSALNADAKLASTYYDLQWVFFQIADYTRDTSWNQCAQAAEAVYRDYVLRAGGNIPGFWIFPHGITEDFLRTGDATSKAAVASMARNAAFARDTTLVTETQDDTMSRETAYSIMAYLNAEHVGEPHRARTELLVSHALGHLDQWFVSRTADYVRPFMFSLTAHALISYDAQIGGNPNILPAIRRGADWLWTNTWLPSQRAFKYTDRNHSSGGQEPAPDLNLLIAPVYAWLWYKTGDVTYRNRADEIFTGGVIGADLGNGKRFNQNYRWSFQYLKWRNSAPLR